MPDYAIQAESLGRHYGRTAALDGFDLEVAEGAVCGLLGPNGAGKTTAVRVLTTLTRPDSGRARVAGADVVREAALVRTRVGLVGQMAALDERLAGRDNLRMFGRLYHLPERAVRLRAEELLAQFDLVEAAARQVRTYSGGMRRRLDLAAGLIIAPRVLFLDEPTNGLDPRSRNDVWSRIRELARAGTTILLTTQYLDEADQLADRIAVMDSGRVIAEGTPVELKRQVGGDRIQLVVGDARELPRAAALLAQVGAGEPEVDTEARSLEVAVASGPAALLQVAGLLARAELTPEDLSLRRPTLDDVFLSLTGRGAAAGSAS